MIRLEITDPAQHCTVIALQATKCSQLLPMFLLHMAVHKLNTLDLWSNVADCDWCGEGVVGGTCPKPICSA